MKTCSVDGCNGKHMARGFCQHHYDGSRRRGSATAIKRTARNGDHAAWLEATAKSETDQCIIWPFGMNPAGYGHTRFMGAQTGAHRAVCWLAHGAPRVSWLQAAHSCGNPGCCNPRHLRWATPAENSGDKVEHGTLCRGSTLPHAALTESQVLEIVSQLGVKRASELAEQFGVSRATISAIAAGRNWSWLTKQTRGGDQNRAVHAA